MTEILGFGRKPFCARRPDAAAFIHGERSYSRIDGMASVFRTKGGVYVAVHLQNLPKCRPGELIFMIDDKIASPVFSSGDFAYIAFYTDMFTLETILYEDTMIRKKADNFMDDEIIARGTILK